MLADLGFSLAIGIALILGSVIFIGPIFIITRDKFFKSKIKKIEEPKIFSFFESYGKILAKRTWTVIIIALVLTGIMYYGNRFIENRDIDFDTILPEDLPELKAFNLMGNEFEESSSVFIYIKLDQTNIDSNEPTDIRDPRIIRYADVLSQQSMDVIYSKEVNSIPFREKRINTYIPGSLAEQKQLIQKIESRDLITQDYSGMFVEIVLDEIAWDHKEEVMKEVYEIVDNTEKPIGVEVYVLGGIAVNYELDQLIGPDSTKTGIIAFTIIIVFLLFVSRSVKYTILSLVTVVIAILWIMGMVGYFNIGWNPIISSVISMTIGIGIDFGIQLSNRFRQELENYDKKQAMVITIKYTLYPMIITVVAALIGFQAMAFGKLKLMGDLGKTMSFSMIASMIVAVTLVAGLMLAFERKKPQQSLKIKNITKKG
jgi:hypothetical protein